MSGSEGRPDWRERYTREIRFSGEVMRTIVPPYPPEVELDPTVFNLESAWWADPVPGFPIYRPGWKASKHGCGDTKFLRACGCAVCVEKADRVDASMYRYRLRPIGDPSVIKPFKVRAGPAREHLAALVAAGWTLRDVADAAGVDASTLSRLRRSSAAMVASSTADGVLGIVLSTAAPQRSGR